ncbi:hypothetical protein NMG60_11023697 [Bertholletia excelsa]
MEISSRRFGIERIVQDKSGGNFTKTQPGNAGKTKRVDLTCQAN